MNTEHKLVFLIFAISIYFSALLAFHDHPTDKLEANAAPDIYLLDDESRVVKRFDMSETLIQVPISCDSQSMGTVFSCKDNLFSDFIGDDSVLIEGGIYVYQLDDRIIVHRLVKCLDDSCNRSVFKGDANYAADKIVARSQIISKVYGVEYR